MIIGEEKVVWMNELDPACCWELLDSHIVGHVGFASDDEQIILPVNYVVDRDSILIRTGRTAVLDALGPGAPAAFEVDDTDPVYETGWSVLVKGFASEVTAPNERLAVERVPLYPWATGPHDHWIRITPHSVTGRVISHGTSSEGFLLPYMPPD
jgi:nitroimidazol reductase NimA-like FMN-containing flavoprotein (pyridoxamine 5'-phosphate oxidase superfamily)